MNCKELGYKVGDEFEVLSSKEFEKGEKIKLDRDDGSWCPRFVSLDRDYWHYTDLVNIKPLEKTMDIEEAYKVMAQNCGIKVGDTVKILRAWEYGELGTTQPLGDAGEKVGEEGKVTDVTGSYIKVDFLDNDYRYPFFVLKKIKDGVEPIELEDYTVHFKKGGTIEVGCQTIDFETVKKIYDRAISTL